MTTPAESLEQYFLAHDACGGPPGTWGYQVCAFFAAPWFLYSVVHGQLAGACSSWEPSVQIIGVSGCRV